MKSTSGWLQDANGRDANGTNSSGFSGLPGGFRSGGFGSFNSIGTYGYWWSSTEGGTYFAWNRYLGYDYGTGRRDGDDKTSGFSVRCLRD
jgi:uncharacterized protein (TIGR02145 family)